MPGRQLGAQQPKAEADQLILAGTMRIKGRPADIRLVQNVLDGDRRIILAPQQADQRPAQGRLGARNAAVDLLGQERLL